MQRVNVPASIVATQAVIPGMKQRAFGRIINVASVTFNGGWANILPYVASKGAVIGMTRALSRELGDHGIRINALAPGLTLSEVVKGRNDYGAMRTANVATRALKREEEPQDLVGTVIFLASPDSDFMTGQTLLVDGGSAMH